jgi:hypothetical protein
MGNFKVSNTLSIFFELKKPPIEHFESFIFLLKKGGELQKISKFLIENSSSRT